MTDEQYERLFKIALRTQNYRITRSNHSREIWRIDDALQSRGFLYSAQYADGNRNVSITLEGLRRLQTRLLDVLA